MNNKLYTAIRKYTILNYYSEVDDPNDNDLSLNNVIFKHLFDGDYSKIIDFPYENIKNASLYLHLVFHNGNYLAWDKSIEGDIRNDYMLAAYKVIDNYLFLLKISDNKELLEELNKYKNIPMFKQYSVIDFLRNNFPNDKILIDVLNNFIKDKTYNTAEKASLLTYPEGTLYLYKNGQPQVVDCTNLANELYNKYSSLDTSIKQFIKKYSKEEFDDTVMTISHVYQRGLIE